MEFFQLSEGVFVSIEYIEFVTHSVKMTFIAVLNGDTGGAVVYIGMVKNIVGKSIHIHFIVGIIADRTVCADSFGRSIH